MLHRLPCTPTPRFLSLLMGTLLGGVVVSGCAVASGGDEEVDDSESSVIASMQAGAPTDFPEVVQVFVDNREQDYCTGVLISATRVVTAAHCMAGASFVVRALHAPGTDGRPQESKARKAGSVTSSSNYDVEVWKEDVATLDLDTPIRVGTYATLHDVGELGSRVIKAIAVGRTMSARNAPLVKTKPLESRSGTSLGYTTGFVSKHYSSGGDSGGPLFALDASGKATHTVIGFERQPDPPREFFTRVTPAVLRLASAPRTTSSGGSATSKACEVRSDKKLYCTNRVSPMFDVPRNDGRVVNTMRSTNSWFLCWGTGDLHRGNNTTWYYSIGDDNDKGGWIPAAALGTSSVFDADPTKYGLRRCS